MHRRRVERRFSEVRAQMDPEGPIPLGWMQEAVAEGRLVRAEGARRVEARPGGLNDLDPTPRPELHGSASDLPMAAPPPPSVR